MDNKNQFIADQAADISKDAAKVSMESAKVAAQAQVEIAREQLNEARRNAAEKFNTIKQQAGEALDNFTTTVNEKGGALKDKLKGAAADALSSAAGAASNLADKLKD